MEQKYKYITTLAAVLLGAVILDLPHFHNGFPFLLGDSQGYIIRAMTSSESNHWSNTYTLIVRWCITGFQTIQVIPFLQSLLISSLMYLIVRRLFSRYQLVLFLGIIIGLLFTTLPWTSVMLMSDIFTPASLLIIYLIVNYEMKWTTLIPLGLIYFFASSCHQSNLAILPLFLIVAVIGNLLLVKNKSKLNLLITAGGLIGLLAMSFALEKVTLKSSPSVNKIKQKPTLGPKQKEAKKKQVVKTKRVKQWKRKNKATLNQPVKTSGATGFYFVIVRLWEVGELDNLLESYCDGNPSNYLCDPNNPYEIKVHLPGVHERNSKNQDYKLYVADNRAFVMAILSKPRLYYACIKALLKRSPVLLQQTQIRDFIPIKNGGIKNGLNTEPINDSRAYGLARQFNGYYSSDLVRTYTIVDRLWWWWLAPLILVGLIIYSISKRSLLWISRERWNLLLMLVLGHLINIVICGTFSNHLNSRYSMRTLWLVNLAVILVLIFFFEYRKSQQTLEVRPNNQPSNLPSSEPMQPDRA